ncbi:MAG: hypothetical protein N4A31_02650 [Rickettsiales bacterium]|jgi:hypothetical protein|nr:hypothetical protein [Rickettsiales bacterium]
MSATNQNVKQALAELANLQDKLTNLNLEADNLEKSLAGYKDKFVISEANIPGNLDYLNKVLFRFFESNNIKDIYELVDSKPDLLSKAIDFIKPSPNTRDPLKGEAYRSLKKAKNNLDEYDNFRTETGDGSKAKDGFKNYVEKVQLITKLEKSYQDLMTHTGNIDLDANNLPKTVDGVKAVQLAIAAPAGKEGDEFVDENGSNDIDENGNFEVGSQAYFAKMYKIARDNATGDISQRKLHCYRDVMEYRVKYYECSNSKQDSTNIDLKCDPIHDQYEISKANCESHFPMVTLSDTVIDDMLIRVEKMHMNSDLKIIMGSAFSAIIDYEELQNVLKIASPEEIQGLGYKVNVGANGETLTQSAEKLLGVTIPAIECGDSC